MAQIQHIASFFTWQSSNLIGGVMTPPYINFRLSFFKLQFIDLLTWCEQNGTGSSRSRERYFRFQGRFRLILNRGSPLAVKNTMAVRLISKMLATARINSHLRQFSAAIS